MSNPELLDLQLLTPHIPGDSTTVPTSTGLFRSTAQLPMVIREAEGRVEGDHINIASTPCSIGGELDSALSLLRDSRFGSATACGIDIDPRTIEVAQQGEYQTRWTAYDGQEQPDRTRQALEDRGFRVKDVRTDIRWDPSREGKNFPVMQLVVDANPVRQGREISFKKADLENTDVLPAQSQDIVLANNLIYHLATNQATGVLWNLARAVRENGILSLHDEPLTANNEASPMSVFGGRNILYREWMRTAGELMAEIFNLDPIAHDATSGRPTLLAKTSGKSPTSSDLARFQETLARPGGERQP